MKERSVIELMVLMLTAVVGVTVVGIGGAVAVVEIRHPDADTSAAVIALGGLISTILGALLGLLAGRTRLTEELSHHPDDEEDNEA